ncbi:MAG: M14 metallopeptidase family protein [Gemmatimonadaceae bacterium]
MQKRSPRPIVPLLIALAIAFSLAPAVAAQPSQPSPPRVTTPQQQFGHAIGADYRLPNYTQLVEYWRKLDRESDRMVLDTIGRTAEGRPQLMAIITAPENFRKLDRYKEITGRLARAEGLTDEQARALAAEGKAVVWIDGGLHATEVLGAQQLMETVYQFVSRTDPETMRILNDVIILAAHVNPDGMELVSDWYMRATDSLKRSTGGIPRLYQKYAGHDNNRDFYMLSQPESENVARQLFRVWYPQIVYNHHQTGPAGTVIFVPPFRDPFNYNLDPLIVTGLDLVGAAIQGRFIAEDKPGATSRRGANYSTWWNGGLRTAPYFHNQIGLLTEAIGNPTPMEIPFLAQRQLPSGDLIMPIAPQTWHFRQSVEYSISANRAVLDLASRHREQFLFNMYKMGKNSIERGGRDTWTASPRTLERIRTLAQGAGQTAGGAQRTDALVGGGIRERGLPKDLWEKLHDPALRDARGYILPADQPDFPTATRFVNTLIKGGVTVHRATGAFTVAGKGYPAGSYVIKAAQAFRPHVLDMFEPQDHPNDFQFPGGPPIPPYDNAGYTLAYQMGVRFDRVLDGFDGPFQAVTDTLVPPPGSVAGAGAAKGYLLSHAVNNGFIATNRLLAKGEEVYWLKEPVMTGGKTYPAGTVYIPAKGSTRALLGQMAAQLGLTFDGVGAAPRGEALKLRPVRVALWDRYGGSMPSGWQRWILERFEFPFEVVYPPTLDAGNLAAKYDVIIFPDGAIPALDRAGGGGPGGAGGDAPGPEGAPDLESIPAEFRGRSGSISAAKTVPQLRQFLEGGGTIITEGSSGNLAYHLGLPVANQLTDSATSRPLPRERYYVPGSVLQVRVDNASPLAYGVGTDGKLDVFFDNNPVFTLAPDAAQKGVRRVAWFENAAPLRSGWAWGQRYLDGGTQAIEATVGKGQLFVFAPEITFRGQPAGTFKLLFNGIYYGNAETVTLR